MHLYIVLNKSFSVVFKFIGFCQIYLVLTIIMILINCLECHINLKKIKVIKRTATENRLARDVVPIKLSQTALFRAKRNLLAFIVRCAEHVHIRNIPVVLVLIGVEGLIRPPFIKVPRATRLAIPIFQS